MLACRTLRDWGKKISISPKSEIKPETLERTLVRNVQGRLQREGVEKVSSQPSQPRHMEVRDQIVVQLTLNLNTINRSWFSFLTFLISTGRPASQWSDQGRREGPIAEHLNCFFWKTEHPASSKRQSNSFNLSIKFILSPFFTCCLPCICIRFANVPVPFLSRSYLLQVLLIL